MFGKKKRERASDESSHSIANALTEFDGRLTNLEDRIDDVVDQAFKRMQRSESAERRMNQKEEAAPCADVHPAITALNQRRGHVT